MALPSESRRLQGRVFIGQSNMQDGSNEKKLYHPLGGIERYPLKDIAGMKGYLWVRGGGCDSVTIVSTHDGRGFSKIGVGRGRGKRAS